MVIQDLIVDGGVGIVKTLNVGEDVALSLFR